MRRIHRNAEKFEVIDLFETLSRKHGLDLDDPDSQQVFLDRLRRALSNSQSNPIIVHGRRIEGMFEHVAASLGKCTLIKREDSGDICSSDPSIRPPDFRIVRDDGKEVFIEVKNCHEADPNHRYKLKTDYLRSIEAYAEIFNREVWIAIFWSRWKKWTLVRPSDFQHGEHSAALSFIGALQCNHMAMLGDMMVATTGPLALRLIADPKKPRVMDASGQVQFTIRDTEIYCEGIRIHDPLEQQLAFYFMLYSDWVTGDRAEVVDGNLVYLEYSAEPRQVVQDQGFQILGSLSDMISRCYNDLTSRDGKVVRLSPALGPENLGVIIPPEYQGRHLPLWRFTVLQKSWRGQR